jgi:tRNA 2-thiouridine synthesizing protein C
LKKLLVIVKTAPYGSTHLGEGLRAAIALAGMDIETTILLTQDAVFAAVKEQIPDIIGMASLAEGLKNAKNFGARILLHSESLQERGLTVEELGFNIETVTTEKIPDLIHDAAATVTF